MSKGGYRGGFNPFRKGGKFASPGGADTSSDSGAAAAADGLGVKNDTIGSTGAGAMNATIRSASGRGAAAAGGSGGSGRAGMAAGGAHAAGGGSAPLLHDAGTNSEHYEAIGRAKRPGASPEVPFTAPTISASTTKIIEGYADEAATFAGFVKANPTTMLDSLGFMSRDVRGGLQVATAVLKDNGFIPATATIKQVDDILAAGYASETGSQRAMRLLRAVGTAIAAGQEPSMVMEALGDLTGPGGDEYAMSVAQEAGQAPDANQAMSQNWG